MSETSSPMYAPNVTPSQLWDAGIKLGEVVALANPTTGARIVGTLISISGCPLVSATVRILGTEGPRSRTETVRTYGMGGWIFDFPTAREMEAR